MNTSRLLPKHTKVPPREATINFILFFCCPVGLLGVSFRSWDQGLTPVLVPLGLYREVALQEVVERPIGSPFVPDERITEDTQQSNETVHHKFTDRQRDLLGEHLSSTPWYQPDESHRHTDQRTDPDYGFYIMVSFHSRLCMLPYWTTTPDTLETLYS